MAWAGAEAGVPDGAGAAVVLMAIMDAEVGAGTAATSPMVGINPEQESRRARSLATGRARHLSGTCRLTLVSWLTESA